MTPAPCGCHQGDLTVTHSPWCKRPQLLSNLKHYLCILRVWNQGLYPKTLEGSTFSGQGLPCFLKRSLRYSEASIPLILKKAEFQTSLLKSRTAAVTPSLISLFWQLPNHTWSLTQGGLWWEAVNTRTPRGCSVGKATAVSKRRSENQRASGTTKCTGPSQGTHFSDLIWKLLFQHSNWFTAN